METPQRAAQGPGKGTKANPTAQNCPLFSALL
ncbi:hypothetical protein B0G38_004661, partial [Arthrobacter sp. VKM Ac-2550]|nr:hypothetical protein [Arthrobacter sp. VKM Ac-2550]